MRAAATRFWTLAATLVALNAAGLIWIRHELLESPVPRLRVLSMFPGDEAAADAADRLSLLFDEALVGPDRIGLPVERPPFRIAPRPAGRWVYGTPERLDFVLDEPLGPGRVYSITAAPDLEQITGRRLAGRGAFRVRTRPLQVLECDLLGADRTHVTIELAFNQAVAPASLLEALTLSRCGGRETIRVEALSRKPGETIVIRAARGGPGDLDLVIAADLRGAGGGERGLDEAWHKTLRAPLPFALLNARASIGSFDARATVDLRFSAPLDRDQPGPPVVVAPPVDGLRTSISRHGLRLAGSFEPGRRYRITVPGTTLSGAGEALGESAALDVEIPSRRPAVRLDDHRGILSPAGNLLLGLRAVNVEALRLSASRVHENNIVAHVRGQGPGATSRRLGEQVVHLDGPPDEPASMALDLGRLLEEPLGVYAVRAESTGSRWVGDSAVVSVTDLALTAKRQAEGLFVWVTSLRHAKPVAGATVTALGATNQTLASALTGADGVALLRVPDDHPDGPAWLVTARLENDLSFLRPDRRRWDLDADRSGRAAPETYDLMLYTERGVYRPGDVVHLTGVIRDGRGAVPPAFPIELRVQRPDGRVVAERIVSPEPGGQGVYHVDIPTTTDGQTGRYRFTAALPGSSEHLGETGAWVEAFVPVRLAVQARPRADSFGPGETAALDLGARYLFDQPGADLPWRLAGEWTPIAHRSSRYPELSFGPLDRGPAVPVTEQRGRLDAEGAAAIELPAPGPGTGWASARLTATVSEIGGRSVSRGCELTADSRGRHLGSSLPGGRVVGADSPHVAVEWALVSGADEPLVPGEVTLLLQRVEHDWVVEEISGRRVFKSVERLTVLEERALGAPSPPAAGGGAAPFALNLETPPPGRYRLRLEETASGATGEIELHVTDGPGAVALASVAEPERLEIVLDAGRYTPGAEARVLVRSPFAGTLLLTLEAREVLAHHVVTLAGRTVELAVPVPADLRGGAFVTGTVVRPLDPGRDTWLPHRAFGMARLVTDHEARRLSVHVGAPERARPGETLSVTVQTDSPLDSGRPALVHLWAVDEGILATTAHTAPDPHGHFFAPRRAEVTSSDGFADLLPDHARPASLGRIGGDAEGRARARRRSPVPAARREAAVIWRRAVACGPDGRVEFDMTMPALRGRLRLMAVAVDHDRYGSGEHPITLTEPIVVEMSGPRAVAPGDSLQVMARLLNTTGAPARISAEARAHGPISITDHGPPPWPLRLEPGAALSWPLRVQAATGFGAAGVSITLDADLGAAEPFRTDARAAFTVRPAAPLDRTAALHRIESGGSLRVDPPAGFLPGTVTTTVTVAGRPDVELGPALRELLDYPYGCLEQTTSRLAALVHAPALLPGAAGDAAEKMVDAGIARLWSMQTPSGGFSYWAGSTQASRWASGYAGLVLIDAQRRGHDVHGDLIDGLCAYLGGELRRTGDSSPGESEKALICRVLTGFGRDERGWMATLADRADRLDRAGRAHLAAAWLDAGRHDRAGPVLAPAIMSMPVTTTSGGRLTSAVRQDAVLLSFLLDLDDEHPWIGPLVRRLEAARRHGRWGSTLETGSALVALARYQDRAGPRDDVATRLRVDGEIVPLGPDAPLVIERDDLAAPLVIEAVDEGVLYATVSHEGLVSAPDSHDRNLQVRRRWLDRAGSPIDPATCRAGDLVQVEIELAVPNSPLAPSRVESIAVVDCLPGGFEIDHPSLLTSDGAGRTDVSDAERVEFLDDRVLLFAAAGRTPRTFRYALRAVTIGSFEIPPVQASCMYDEDASSIHGGGRVEVLP